MRWVIPLLVVAGLLESVAIKGFVGGGWHIELTLVLVIGWAALRGWEEGVLVGIMGGVIVDLLSAAPFGVNALRLGLLGLAAGSIISRLAHGSVLLPMAAAACGSLLGFVFSVFALQASGLTVVWERSLLLEALPSAVLAAAAMAVGYPLLRATVRRNESGDQTGES